MTEDLNRRSYSLHEFRLENGVTRPNAKLAYATFGTLNARRDNAILIPSWYGSDYHGYDFLIGPGRALDPAKTFLVATEMFGNGFSSSPSNTAPPFDGPAFPSIAIRDNVEAAYRLLTLELGVSHHERALAPITARVLYMPSETDLYFPLGDAKYESGFIKNVTFVPIPSLGGHSAGSGGNPTDNAFLNDHIRDFLDR
jgi:homoserine acetyltransferase